MVSAIKAVSLNIQKSGKGIEKVRIDSTGQVIENSLDDVFKPHAGQITADGRYSIGGKLGDAALYSSIGDNALQTIAAETKTPLSELIIGTQEVKLNKVLDLTDPRNLEALGIDNPELLILNKVEDSNAYELTQILGNLAQKHGFDAIKAPSQPNQGGVNLIVLKPLITK